MSTDALDAAGHRKLAVQFFNETWTYLDKPLRTIEENDRMAHLAHASRLHWELCGGAALNLAIGEWQIARVYSVLGQAESAVRHARRGLELVEKNGIGGFYLGAAHEGMARALGVAGEAEAAREHHQKAGAICARLPDEEERKMLMADLESIAPG